MKFDFKKNLPHIISVLAIVIVNMIYFSPQFQGKKLVTGDTSAYRGAVSEIDKYREITGQNNVLWTNSMFGGMPSYTISMKRNGNVISFIKSTLQLTFSAPAGMFILGMLSFYFCLLLFGVNPWVSLSMAIVFGLSTSNLMLIGAGHNTKVQTIMSMAPIIAGVALIMKKRYWLGASAFTMFMALSLHANHPQMIYYMGLALSFLMIFLLVDSIQKKDLVSYFKGIGTLIVCSLIALGISASVLMPVNEYSKETMRGNPILEKTDSERNSSSNVKGLDYEYAMNWSAGALDAISTFIPFAAGGGTVETFDKDSRYAKVTQQRRKVSAPSYFGVLPSTAGPYYFGAIAFFLFILGALIYPGKLKWWLITGVIFTFMLSFGKNFDLLNRPMFDYLPLYSKFRTPNSVLSITGILILLLAALGFNEVIRREDKASLVRPLLIALGSVAGFSILFGLIGPSLISFESAYDGRMGGNQQVLDALYADRASMLSSSAYRTAGFVIVAGLALFAFLKGKLNQYIVLAIVGVLAIVDQISITKNYFGDNWKSKRVYEQVFMERPADKQILADKDPHYRVQDFTIDTYNSASSSYFHKTVGGYAAAKLQRTEDVKNQHLANRSQENPYGNQAVLNMLNTKYFIVPTGEKTSAAQQNPGALGNAWFVGTSRIVNSANEEIDGLNNFDPQSTAIVHKEFSEYINGLNGPVNGTIKLTKYSPEIMEYSSTSTSDQLAVFSEVWYGPDLGWQAYIDDQPVDHIRANYLLRALKIPSGNHTIRFEFKPTAYSTGKMISLISSLLLLLILGLSAFKYWKGDISESELLDS